MPTSLQAAILGIVQGATEFVPVSSSAHLILARAFFGFDGDKFGLPFDVACHVGTLVAVLIYFRADVSRMIAALPDLFGASPAARLIRLLAVATLPAIVVGLLFGRLIEERLRTPVVAALMLAIGAFGFFIADRVGARGTRGARTRWEDALSMGEAVLIGCAQALALIPGVSRSGATMTAALLLGLRRTEAARFSFLLAIPAIIAAAGKETPKIVKAGMAGDDAMLFVIGVVMSAIVGYISVKFLIAYLQRHSLDAFGWYRLALAASVAVWLFTR